MIENYVVYVKTDSGGYIIAVHSSAFLSDTTGWTEIDSGYGDKYHHAQGNYFPLPIITDSGAYRYKLVDGVPVECTQEEIAQQVLADVTIPYGGFTYEIMDEDVGINLTISKEVDAG